MKKVFFILVVIVLAWWAWYMNNNSSSGGFNKWNFDKALQIMQNLQSAAIPSSLTDDQLNVLEQAYNDADDRKPEIEAFRESDRTALATLLAANNITGSQATTITNLANGIVDDYKNGISAQLAALNVSETIKTNIKKLTDSINSLSNDIRLTLQFINWYSSKRPNICLTTDTKNDQYVKGSITFKYDTTRAAVVESCSGNTLSEHFCSGLEYTTDTTHDKTRTCEFSCNDGACTKGSLGAVSIVNGATNTATTMTDVKTNQQFWLKVPASRLHRARATSNTNGTTANVVSTGMGYTSTPTVTVSGGTCTTRPTGRATVVDGYVTEVKLIGAVGCTWAPTITIAEPPATTAATAPMKVTITSPSLPAKCTYNGDSTPLLTGNTDAFFWPITCNTAEAHNFSLNLIGGNSTTPITTATKTVDVGGTSMGNFTITAPDKVAAGNNFNITVKAVGTNGLPYVGHTGSFFIIVDGDNEATFPGAAQTIPAGQSEVTIPNIKFSTGGSITITVRGTGVTETAQKTITVTGAKIWVKLGAITSDDTDINFDRNFSDNITIDVGETGQVVSYKWIGTNGNTGDTTYTCVKATGVECGRGQWSQWNGLSGTFTQTFTSAHKWNTYTFTYKVKKTGMTEFATDTLTLTVKE